MTSRAAGLGDLRRVSTALALALKEDSGLIAAALPQPFAAGAVGSWTDYLPQAIGLRRRLRAFMEEDRGELRSVALVYDGHRREWVVLALAALGEAGIDGALRLLSGVAAAAARAGMLRLFAAVPVSSRAQEPFFQAGFYSYTRESWLVSSGAVSPEPACPITVREACRADAHDLFRFYAATTPHAVQRAEQLTVDDFDIGRRAGAYDPPHLVGGNPLAMRRAAALLAPGEDGARGIALAFEGLGRHPHVVKVRSAGSDVDLARHLARLAMRALPPGRPIVAPVRSHEEHVLRALLAEGFRDSGTAMLFVKELALRIEEPAFAPAVVR